MPLLVLKCSARKGNQLEWWAVKQPIILFLLVLGLVGSLAQTFAQHGGRGSSGAPESTPLGVQHIAPNAGSDYADYLYGVIKDLNKDGMILTKTKAGADQTFKFNKKTKFIQDGKDISLKSLKMGDEVWVDVDEDKKTGDLIARKVVTGIFIMPTH